MAIGLRTNKQPRSISVLELTDVRIIAGEERFELPATTGFSQAASSLISPHVHLGQEFQRRYPETDVVLPDLDAAVYATVKLEKYVPSRDLPRIFGEIVTVTPEETLVRAAQIIDLQLPHRDRLDSNRYWLLTPDFLVFLWDYRLSNPILFVDAEPRERLTPLAPGEHIFVPANRLPSNDR